MQQSRLTITLTGIALLAQFMIFSDVTAGKASVACDNEKDCQVKWQRAEQWIRKHSYWPVKTVTDTLIETERQKFRRYSRLYYRITKEKTATGQTLIQFNAGCLPSVHCDPDSAVARTAFKSFLATGKNSDALH